MTEKKQQKIIGYMSALYNAMADAAENVSTEGDPQLVWQGRLIETCTSVGIPTGYYKRVVDTMRTIGCIELLHQGRRGKTLTAMVLRYPPTQELYDNAIVKSGWQDLTRTPSLDTLGGQVRDIQKSLGGLAIVEAFKTYDERFRKMETALRDLSTELASLKQQHEN